MSYTLRATVAPDGEVHPLIVGSDGLPLWWPNLYLLTAHRNRGVAFGTLAAYGNTLCRLYAWAEKRELPIDRRFLDRTWLLDWELNSLADELSVQVRGVSQPRPWRSRPGNVEQFLAPKVSKAPLVANRTSAVRLNLITDYLSWLGTEGVNRAPFLIKRIHENELQKMILRLLKKRPICHDHNTEAPRKYDRDGVLRLLEVTLPDHPDNPWMSKAVQARNHLLVHMLFTFGFRIGELAALKVKDIDFRAQVLAVARRPDDHEDPRGRYAPHQKTRARVMALELVSLLKAYVNKVRNRHDQALNHPYLLVSEQGGRPISMSALEKVFRELRENVTGLPVKLTPHYLRHAWNYEWSLVCKDKGIPQDLAEQMRKTLMGWKMSSAMNERYNEPYIQERADECSLEVQRRMWSVAKEAQGAMDRMKNLAH